MAKADKAFDALAQAVDGKQLGKIKELLAKTTADARPYNAMGDTLLAFSVEQGAPLSVIKLLVELGGAKLDAKNPSGDSPITYALAKERKDVIEYFASRGAKIKYTPFHKLPQAEKNKRLGKTLESWYDDGCAKQLAANLAGGADPNTLVSGMTPLELLARNSDDRPLYKVLLAAGADPARLDNKGGTPLHSAASHAHGKGVAAMLDAGAAIDLRDRAGNTPLHACAASGYNGGEQVAKLLLDRGADPLATNKAGKTAIDVATPDIKAMLVKRAVKPASKEARALLAAVAKDDVAAVAKLLAAGADPCAVDPSGKGWGPSDLEGVAALHVACGRGVGAAVRDALLAHGKLDANVKSIAGRTPLHFLAQYGQGAERRAAIAALLARGADANAADDSGETALFELVSFYKLDDELELIDQLVAAGAKPGHKNAEGQTVLDRMFERAANLHEMNDKAGFVRVLDGLVARGFPTAHGKAIAAWLATKQKYLPPKTGAKGAKGAKAAKAAKPSKTRAAFAKLTAGKLAKLAGKGKLVKLGGEKRSVAFFDWFAYQDEQAADKHRHADVIREYHIASPLAPHVDAGRMIPIGVVGLGPSFESYAEVAVDGTLFVDFTKPKGDDAPVVFVPQSYMGLSPSEPLELDGLTYRSVVG